MTSNVESAILSGNSKRKGGIVMNLCTILFIVGLLGAFLGIKKPWLGGISGLIIAPLLFYFAVSSNIILLAIVALFCFLFAFASGLYHLLFDQVYLCCMSWDSM